MLKELYKCRLVQSGQKTELVISPKDWTHNFAKRLDSKSHQKTGLEASRSFAKRPDSKSHQKTGLEASRSFAKRLDSLKITHFDCRLLYFICFVS